MNERKCEGKKRAEQTAAAAAVVVEKGNKRQNQLLLLHQVRMTAVSGSAEKRREEKIWGGI
jgi:hypothetical protein